MTLHAKALQTLRDYYESRSGRAFILYEDEPPPVTLRGVRWADEIVDRYGREFFTDQNSTTGLVPVGGPQRPHEYFAVSDLSVMSPLKSLRNAARLAEYSENTVIIDRLSRLARGIVEHHRNGMWYAFGCDARSGERISHTFNCAAYGELLVGLVATGLLSVNDVLTDAAKQLLSAIRTDFKPYIPEAVSSAGAVEPRSFSSDGIYVLRGLHECWKRSGDAEYATALKRYVRNYLRSFQHDYGHPSTQIVDRRGTPGGVWYGDGHVNYLWLFVVAESFGLEPGLAAFDESWRTLVSEAVDGIPPHKVTRGVGSGIAHKNPHLHLEALIVRYQDSRSDVDRAEIQRFMNLLDPSDYRTALQIHKFFSL